MNSEEIKKLRELVLKNWKINKFAYLMTDASGKYPFFEKLKLKNKLSEIPNSSFDESKHVDMTEQEALCVLVQGRLESGTDEGGLKALDAHLKGKVSDDKQDKAPNRHTNISVTKQRRHKSNPELHKIFWRAFVHLRDKDEFPVEPQYKQVWETVYNELRAEELMRDKKTIPRKRKHDPHDHIEVIDPVYVPAPKLQWIISGSDSRISDQGTYSLSSLPPLLSKLKKNPPKI